MTAIDPMAVSVRFCRIISPSSGRLFFCIILKKKVRARINLHIQHPSAGNRHFSAIQFTFGNYILAFESVPVNPFYSEDGILNHSGVFPFLHLFTVVHSGMIARSISLDIPLAFHILRFFSVYLLCDFPFIYAVFCVFHQVIDDVRI
ncbi:MAG: hypothetical protein E7190_01045 [Erysipelotrichaceae bacterium]|nr:hypothetical protein [Erysipelotrichaceae bacterium]